MMWEWVERRGSDRYGMAAYARAYLILSPCTRNGVFLADTKMDAPKFGL